MELRSVNSVGVPRDFASIMQAGVHAPSPENRHCFEYVAATDGIGLFGGARYVTAPWHVRVLNRISLGAVIENMTIRAARLGYVAQIHLFEDPVRPSMLAELKLERGPAVADPGLDDAIGRRHTNRSVVYSGPPLDAAGMGRIGQLIADLAGVSLQFFDTDPQRRILLRLVRRAEAERFAVRSMHEDLFSAIRFDVGWRASVPEGLPPGALGVEPGMRWAFAQLRRWPVMNVLARLGMHRLLGWRAAGLPCRLAPHRGVLATSLPLEQGTIAVGRALQRIWLEAERAGWALQPLPGAALLSLDGYTGVRARTREDLQRGWRSLTGQSPLMVFRMGRAKPPAIRAGRQDWTTYLRH